MTGLSLTDFVICGITDSMNRRRTMIIALSLLAVLVVASGVVVWNYGRNHYWWGVSDAQAVLLADPMAARDLDGLKLVRAEEPKTRGVVFESPAPRLGHWFETVDDTAKTIKRLSKIAVVNGWKETEGPKASGSWSALKHVNGDRLLLIIEEDRQGSLKPESGSNGLVRVILMY